MPSTDYTKLINKSLDSLKNSYAPYSKFRVGAALLTGKNKIYQGSNIECASFSLTICAERVAFAKAISEGERSFKAIAISTGNKKFAFPCGACRQFMIEFAPDLTVILVKSPKAVRIITLKELLPEFFHL